MKSEAQNPRIGQGKKKALFLTFLVLVILLVPAMSWISPPPADTPKPSDARPPVSRMMIEQNPVVNFDPFLIPLEAKSRFTLITLSFALKLPNGKTKEEMEKRTAEVRGFIYDTLQDAFVNVEGIPSIQAVKDGINRAVNKALPGTRLIDVYISQFLAL